MPTGVAVRGSKLYPVIFLWLVACALAVANYALHRNPAPFGYDEGDYYEAVQRGFIANWTDADDMPPGEFFSMGLKAIKGEISKAELSRAARERNATIFLRHYHPPLAYYMATAIQSIGLDMTLHDRLRLAGLGWMVLWITAFCALFVVWPSARSLWIIILPASTSYGMAVVGFNMHIVFGLMASSFFYFWFEYSQTPEAERSPAMRRVVLFFMAAALVSVAYGLFLSFFTGLWVLWSFVRSSDKKAFLRRKAGDLGWLVAFLLLLWPASILALELPRSYAFQMYIALFRLPGLQSTYMSFADMILQKWNSSVPELVLGVALLGIMLYHWKTLVRTGSLLVAFGLMAMIMYTQLNPVLILRWYLFPVFAILFVFYLPAVFRLGYVPARFNKIVWSVAAAAVLFICSVLFIRTEDSTELWKIFGIVKQQSGREVFIPLSLAPQTQPYVPDVRLIRKHDTEFETEHLADSLAVWRQRGLVIVSKKYAAQLPAASDSTENYLFFARQR